MLFETVGFLFFAAVPRVATGENLARIQYDNGFQSQKKESVVLRTWDQSGLSGHQTSTTYVGFKAACERANVTARHAGGHLGSYKENKSLLA